MNSKNLVWILVGGNFDIYIGEQKRYALVEYYIDNDYLKLSIFNKSCVYICHPNNLVSTNEERIFDKMIKEGKNFLFKINDHKYGYFSNGLNGKYIFTDTENINIENKLKELVFSECLKN
jgi:hypothetical protein